MEKRYWINLLVIGSGLGGLSFALKVADHGKVCLITRQNTRRPIPGMHRGALQRYFRTRFLQQHVRDTLIAGDGLCNEKVGRGWLSRRARPRSVSLSIGGQNLTGSPMEIMILPGGGHSEHRILHHRIITGEEIQRALSRKGQEPPEY